MLFIARGREPGVGPGGMSKSQYAEELRVSKPVPQGSDGRSDGRLLFQILEHTGFQLYYAVSSLQEQMRTQERKKRADKDERERWDAKKEAEIRVGFVPYKGSC